MRFTLFGITNYMSDFWDNIEVPTGIDKEILIETIMERSGMLFPFHQQPHFLKRNIENWFLIRKPEFERIISALSAEYNPIENYDRSENWTDTPNVTHTRSGGHSIEDTDKDRKSVTETNGNNTESVTTDNSSTWADINKNEGGNNSTTTLSGSTDSVFTYNNEAETETGERSHEGRIHGNIGVTTNQQMIQAEIALREYNLYDQIAKWFEDKFLMQVY